LKLQLAEIESAEIETSEIETAESETKLAFITNREASTRRCSMVIAVSPSGFAAPQRLSTFFVRKMHSHLTTFSKIC
jgi:hypothetical protein